MAPQELDQASSQRKPARTPGWVWVIVGAVCGFLLLIIIGIIAAIALPSLLVAKGKAQVQKTMGEMRTLSTSMEMYRLDRGRYPTAPSANEIIVILETEKFGVNLPRQDAWGRPFIIEVPPDGGRYCIISTGQDGLREAQEPYSELPRVNPEPGADLVLVDGDFVSCPEGAPR